MMKLIFTVLVVVSGFAHATPTPQCPAVNWGICTSFSATPICSTGLCDVATRFAPFDRETVAQAFADPSSCNQQCLVTFAQRFQGSSSTSLEQQASALRTKINVDRSMARLNIAAELFIARFEQQQVVRAARSPGMTGVGQFPACPVTFNSRVSSCAQTPEGTEFLNRIKQRFGLSGDGVVGVFQAFSRHLNDRVRTASYQCDRGPAITYMEYLRALTADSVTAELKEVVDTLADDAVMQAIDAEVSVSSSRNLMDALARRIAFRRVRNAQGDPSEPLSQILVQNSSSDEFLNAYNRALDQIRHPWVRSFLSDSQIRRTLTGRPIRSDESLASYSQRLPLNLNDTSVQENLACNNLSQSFADIVCGASESGYVDIGDPDPITVMAKNFSTNPESQISLMQYACAQRPLSAASTRSPIAADPMREASMSIVGGMNALLESRNTVDEDARNARENFAITSADTSFVGFARHLCKKRGGAQGVSLAATSGVYSTTRIPTSAASRPMYNRLPVNIIDAQDLNIPQTTLSADMFSTPDLRGPAASEDNTAVTAIAPVSDSSVPATQALAPMAPAPTPPAAAITTPMAMGVSAPSVESATASVAPAPAASTRPAAVEANRDLQRLEELEQSLQARVAAQSAQLGRMQGATRAPASEVEPTSDSEQTSSVGVEATVTAPRSSAPARSTASRPTVSAAAPVVPNVASITTASSAQAPVPVSDVSSLTQASVDQIATRGYAGLGAASSAARSASARATAILTATRPGVSLRTNGDKTSRLVDAQGQEITDATTLSDVDFLSVLNSINEQSEFAGSVEIVAGKVEISLNGKVIRVDPSTILDPERRALITQLAGQISLRRSTAQLEVIRQYKASVLARALQQSNQRVGAGQ